VDLLFEHLEVFRDFRVNPDQGVVFRRGEEMEWADVVVAPYSTQKGLDD
jgi:hypothetical protein